MTKCARTKRRLATVFTALFLFGLSSLVERPVHAQSAGETDFLPETEEELFRGESASAYLVYKEFFSQANTIEERLQRIGPLARVAFVDGRLAELIEGFSGDAWESVLLRAAVFQYLEDLPAALGEIQTIDFGKVPERFRSALFEQQKLWASAIGDAEALVSSARQAFEEDQVEENHAAFVSALFGADREEELFQHMQGRKERLVEDADFWRSWLPEFQKRNWLLKAAEIFVPIWENGPPEARFALGELLLFSQKNEAAREIFWTVFEEPERESTAENGFRRLNHFFHHRFAVKNRIGQASGSYGSEASRDYAFFGLRHDLEVRDLSSARDGALNYLREIELSRGTSREFLQRLRVALDSQSRSASERILAFAQVGAPGFMLEEIESFVRGPELDAAIAELALIAINRLILSTERFPEYRFQMRDLATVLEKETERNRSEAVSERIQEMRERIFRRLGFDDPLQEQKLQENVFSRLTKAVEDGEPAEAEKIYRDLEQKGEAFPYALLLLAKTWLNDGNPSEAAARVGELLREFYQVNPEAVLSTPLAWADAEIAHSSPWHDEQQQEMLMQVYEVVSGSTETWAELKEIWEREWAGLSVSEQIGAIAIKTDFFRWANEPDETLAVARQGLALDDPELKLFCAWTLGLAGSFDEAEIVLESLVSAENKTSPRACRLLFALAVVGKKKEVALEQAKCLEEQSLLSGERVQVAAGLETFDEMEAALEWLKRIEPAELFGSAREQFQAILLKIYSEKNPEKSIGLARSILLADLPDSVYRLGEPLRVAALKVLEENGKLEDYEGELKSLEVAAEKSISLHLLRGESAEFRGNLPLARECFLAVVQSAPEEVELQLELAEWLGQNNLFQEAMVQYQQILVDHSTSALLDLSTLLRVFQEVGQLEFIAEFLERWEMPESKSLDEFYGLQPTAHIFELLGEKLRESGQDDAAIRAWEKGLAINPIEFTERIRISLAQVYREKEAFPEIIGLLESYVTEENFDSEIYIHQPFASAVPRWINSAIGRRTESGVEQLLTMIEEVGEMQRLSSDVERWRCERPENFSLSIFDVYLAVRTGNSDWKEKLLELKKRYSDQRGSLKSAWAGSKPLFAD